MTYAITFFIYFLFVLGIAIYAYRQTKSHEDYVLGGRSLGSVVTAMGVGASDMSGWLLLGLPGAMYVLGLSNIWMPVGLFVGAFLCWTLVAKRLRVYTEVANNSLTIPAYIENRFQDHSHYLRFIIAILVIIFFTVYSASGFKGGAILFSTAFDIPYLYGLIICAVVIVLYTTIGGFLAVNWVDLFQGLLMLLTLLVLPIFTIMAIGGVKEAGTIIHNVDPSHFNVLQGVSLLTIFSLLGWGLGYFGQPHILVRFMASRTKEEIATAKRVCLSWMFFSLLGAVLVGFFGVAYFADATLANPETVFLALAKELFNVWIVGFFYAAVLSAIMSTIAAQLLVASSAIAEDGYRVLLKRTASQAELIWIGRLTVLLVAMTAFFWASNPESTVLSLVAYAWGGLGATLGPVILLSLFWPRMTYKGAATGFILSLITVLSWEYLETLYEPLGELYSVIPGFIVGVLGIVIGTMLGRPPEQKVLDDFAEYQRRLHEAPKAYTAS